MPKTAGTSTDRLFALSGLALEWRDDQNSSNKHLAPADYPELIALGSRKRVVNVRRLPHWLLSNWQHKKVFMNLDLDKKPITNGLFYKFKEKAWLPADWWLEKLAVDETWIGLRVDHLKLDFIKLIFQHDEFSFSSLMRICFAKNLNSNNYTRDLHKWFTKDDLSTMYLANPLWTSLEKQVYGNILQF